MTTAKIKSDQQFREIYQQLNTQQQQAVETIEGPVIVNAGPGTGKTQILAARIGNILLNTDVAPQNILCLTFTDNGSVEMRNRLLQIVGTTAYNIPIHTFHSFCNEVIQDNLSYFGKYNLEPISELEESELFKNLIDSIGKDSLLKRYTGDVYYDQARLKHLFTLMKKEAWTVDYFNERIDRYIKSLPEKEGFYYKRKYKDWNAGDPNPRLIAEETEKMEVLRAAVNLYPRYIQMMDAIQRYTYDDMILWVLNAFKNNTNLLLDYQERYQYFLVDEFQDTSGSQNGILQYLTSYWDVPNVFVVGDADQSIFSFQDANVENIIHFENRYGSALTKIDLVNNYRSTQTILNTAYQLITNNQLRTVSLQNDHPLKASNATLQSLDIPPAFIEYPNTVQESVAIAAKIEELINSGINGSEIAVIYRNHDQVTAIVAVLQAKQIPLNIRRQTDILQLPLIENLITVLTWINNETRIPYSADDLLFKIMHFSFFDIQPAQAAMLSMRVNEKNIGRRENRAHLRTELNALKWEAGDLFTPADNAEKKLSETLEDLLKQLHNTTLQYFIELVIKKTNVIGYIMQHAEKPFLMQALTSFFNFVKDATRRNPELQLQELLANIQLLKKDNIPIPLYKITSAANGVNLVTAHGSKGSEYAYVFIIGCTSNTWDSEKSGSRYQFKYPDNLTGDNSTGNNLEESRRLFYVALTRAKTHLTISYSAKDGNGKPQTKSTFVAEIVDATGYTTVKETVPDDQLLTDMALQFADLAQPEIELIEAGYIDELLRKYSLSVTHLNNYLDCPLKFYYQNLIKIPAAKSGSMVFGSAFHFALQRLFEKMKAGNGKFPLQEIMLDDFLWFMQKNRDAFTPEEFVRRIEYGEKIIPEYYQAHIQHWHRNVHIEYNLRNVQLDGIPLNGKIDKIEFFGNNINVVDYKTGKFTNARRKLQPPNDKEPNGGDYWRQAVFYKILIDNNPQQSWQMDGVTFEFVEPNNDQYPTVTIQVAAADVTTVSQQIKQVWKKIQNREFHTGCGKPDCEWCNFVKRNELYVHLNYLSEEEENI